LPEDFEIFDEDRIKQEAIDIKKVVEAKPKRKGLLGAIKNVMDSVETRKEHKKLIKACEEEAYAAQKQHDSEEKFAKELEAAKKRGEFKAKPITEKIKIKREEVKEKRKSKSAPIDIRKTDEPEAKSKPAKKGGIAGALAQGTARMMETSTKKEKPKMQLVSKRSAPTLTKQTDKKLWK